MGDFMGRTMTNMQMGCYLINGYVPSCPNHITECSELSTVWAVVGKRDYSCMTLV